MQIMALSSQELRWRFVSWSARDGIWVISILETGRMKNRKNARVPELRLRGYDALSFVAQLPSCYVFAFNYITSLFYVNRRLKLLCWRLLIWRSSKSSWAMNNDLSALGIRTLVSPWLGLTHDIVFEVFSTCLARALYFKLPHFCPWEKALKTAPLMLWVTRFTTYNQWSTSDGRWNMFLNQWRTPPAFSWDLRVKLNRNAWTHFRTYNWELWNAQKTHNCVPLINHHGDGRGRKWRLPEGDCSTDTRSTRSLRLHTCSTHGLGLWGIHPIRHAHVCGRALLSHFHCTMLAPEEAF